MRRLLQLVLSFSLLFGFSQPMFSLCPQTNGATFCVQGPDHIIEMGKMRMKGDAGCDEADAHDDCRYQVDQLTPDKPALITQFSSIALINIEAIETVILSAPKATELTIRARPGPIYILKESFLI